MNPDDIVAALDKRRRERNLSFAELARRCGRRSELIDFHRGLPLNVLLTACRVLGLEVTIADTPWVPRDRPVPPGGWGRATDESLLHWVPPLEQRDEAKKEKRRRAAAINLAARKAMWSNPHPPCPVCGAECVPPKEAVS